MSSWNRILLATANADKVAEMAELLQDLQIDVLSIEDIGVSPVVVEDQPTLRGNAVKKAVAFHQSTGLPALADDTGLFVEALDGAPGVFSSRFAGAGASYDANVDELLRRLTGVPLSRRSAQFMTVMALAHADGIETVEGVCEGYILPYRRGEGGFGYDPLFFVPELDRTFAEMTRQEKNRISHRGLALANMKNILRDKLRGVAQSG